MRKITISLTLTIFLMTCFSTTTFANSNVLTVDGQEFPYKIEDKSNTREYFLYYLQHFNNTDAHNSKTDLKLLLDFNGQKVQTGTINNQMTYVPILNNGSVSSPDKYLAAKQLNPLVLSPLKSKANALKIDKDIILKGKDTENFKTKSADKRLPFPFESVRNLFFTNTKGNNGIYRYVFNKDADKVDTIGFYPDRPSKNQVFEDFKLYNNIGTLHNGNYYIKETKLNSQFKNLVNDVAKNGWTSRNKATFMPYAKNYILYYSYKNSISSGSIFRAFDNTANNRTDTTGDINKGYGQKLSNSLRVSPTSNFAALWEQSKRFYNYANVSQFAGYGIGGNATISHLNDDTDWYASYTIPALDGDRNLIIHKKDDLDPSKVQEDYVQLVDESGNELPYKWIEKTQLAGKMKFKEYQISDKTKPYKFKYNVWFAFADGFANPSNTENAFTKTFNKTIFTKFTLIDNKTGIFLQENKNVKPTSNIGTTEKMEQYYSNPLDLVIRNIIDKEYDFKKIMSKIKSVKPENKAEYTVPIDLTKLKNDAKISLYLSDDFNHYNLLKDLGDKDITVYNAIQKDISQMTQYNQKAIKDTYSLNGTNYINGNVLNIFNDNEVWQDDGTFVFLKFIDSTNDLKLTVDKVEGEIKPGNTITVSGKVQNNGQMQTKITGADITFGVNLNNPNSIDITRNKSVKAIITNPKLLKGYDGKVYDYWNYKYTTTLPNFVATDKIFLATVIHKRYDQDGTKDNVWIQSDDYIEKVLEPSTTFQTSKTNDMSLEMWLEDASGTKYNTQISGNTDGTVFKLSDKPQVYKLKMRVKKEKGTTPIINPVVELKVRSGADETLYSQNITFLKTITNIGDYAEYTYTNVNGTKYFIEADAKISDIYSAPNSIGVILDDNPENNRVHKIWTYELDLAVENVSVSPSKLTTASKVATTVNSAVVVNATIRLNSKDISTLNNVDVKLYINGSFYNSQQKTIGDGTQVSWNIPLRAYYAGNTPFKVVVNESRAIKEFSGSTDPYKNNEDIGVLSVNKPSDTRPKICNGKSPVYSNTWSVKFTLQDGGGLSGPYTACGKSGCWQYYICNNPYPPPIRYKTKQFTETLSLVMQYKSKKTNWNWVNAPSSINIIAGEGFELKWTAKYFTDRPDMPSYKTSCNSWRSPDVSSFVSLINTTFTVDGYKFPELPDWFVSSQLYTPVYYYYDNDDDDRPRHRRRRTPVPVSTGNSLSTGLVDATIVNSSWSNYTVEFQIGNHIDALGKTTRKLYTDVKDVNKTITFGAWTNQFYGYSYTNDRWYEPSYGSGQKELCAYSQFTINIKNPLEIQSQEVEKYNKK